MNMPQTFSYTAQRRGYLVTLAAFTLSMSIESSLLILVIMAAVPTTFVKVALPIAVIGLYVFLVFTISRPLWTKHRLTETHLELRYGSLRLDIPREAILSVKATRERLTMFQPMKARVDTKKRQLMAAFSEDGQVLLTLNKQLAVRIGRTTSHVTRILLNADEPDRLLAALMKHEQVSQEDSVAIAKVIPTVTDREPLRVLTIAENTEVTIRLEQLTRRYRAFTAVDALDMTIRRGEIYGFLGSNGAGKTTTLKMLVGLLQPDSGRAWIVDYDVWREPLAAKKLLGYVADRSMLYERLTGCEFLNFLAHMRGLLRAESEQRIKYLLDLLELSEYADRSCGSYSFGMKRKLSLAAALLHQPQVLILDEPLNGLDPRSSRHVKDLLITLSQQGTTVLLSTHDLSVAESLCHRVGILHRGRLLVEGSASELRELAATSNLEDVFLSLTEEQTASQQAEVAI